MKNIFKRITVLTLITTIILSNNICQVSAKEKDTKTNRNTFQVSPNETLDISLLETKGIVKNQKTTHPSKNEVAVTTTQYYFDDVNVRNQIRDEVTSELSDIDEVQALYTDWKYQTTFDTTCSYEFHCTVYWSTYVDNGHMFGRVDQVIGGYTKRDWTVSVVSQFLSVGESNGTSSSVYNTYIAPDNSNWSVITYDKLSYLPISSTSVFGCIGGAYYDIEFRRNAGSWINEIYTTCWGSGGISLSDYLSTR